MFFVELLLYKDYILFIANMEVIMEELKDFTIIDENKIIDVVMTAGRILLESGAETYRVEDTMARIATSYGLENTHSFVTSTAIIFSLNDRTKLDWIRIDERSTDLEKIS